MCVCVCVVTCVCVCGYVCVCVCGYMFALPYHLQTKIYKKNIELR